MPLNALAVHRPSVKAYHGRNLNPWLRTTDGIGVQTCYRRVCGSTAGHWGSGSVALAISLRRCRATTYTSSVVPRFTDMLLSPRPFGSRLVVRLGVLCPELRPTLLAILSVRDTAHGFPSYGSPIAFFLRHVSDSLLPAACAVSTPHAFCDLPHQASVKCRPRLAHRHSLR
jgi:hypothetical protein